MNFLQQESRLKVVDNSGALSAKLIRLYRPLTSLRSRYMFALVRITKINTKKTIKRSTMFTALVTGFVFRQKRKSGVTSNAHSNEVVLLKKDKTPISSRIYKYVFFEFKFVGYSRLCAISRGLY